MREHDRCRHQFFRVIARKSKHETLIARALLGAFLALRLLRIHALRDVVRLVGDDGINKNLLRVKYVVIVDVTNVAHRLAHDLVDRDDVFQMRPLRQIRNGDLAADDHYVAFRVRLAGDPASAVASEAGIEHGIGNGIANFVGVTFTNGFGRKDKTAEHVKGI